jgi:ABC-type transport system involved in cytochrome c biogenesis permease component
LLTFDRVVLAVALATDEGTNETLALGADSLRLVTMVAVAVTLSLKSGREIVDVLLAPLVIMLVLGDGVRLAAAAAPFCNVG